MPLRLRVCGRDTGTTEVDGAACNGLEDGDVDESAGDEEPVTVASDSVGEEGRPTGETGRADEAAGDSGITDRADGELGIVGRGAAGVAGRSVDEGDVRTASRTRAAGEDGVMGRAAGEDGVTGRAAEDSAAAGEEGRAAGDSAVAGVTDRAVEMLGATGSSSDHAWARKSMPCNIGRSTCPSEGGDDDGESSKSSKRAPRPVPAPWLGNSKGEYATSSNWSEATEDECRDGGSTVDTVRLAKGKTCSSNTTS